MTKDNIKRRIKELQQEALEEAGYNIDDLRLLIMRKLTGIALTDLSDIVEVIYPDDARRQEALNQMAETDGGQGILDFGDPMLYIKPTKDWTPAERAAVKSIQFSRKDGIIVEIEDKQSALRLLADIAGLTKSADLNLNLSVTESLLDARQRALNSEREPVDIEPTGTGGDDTG
jgi:hypothetical protein